jgi:hypothetical protein
MQCPFIHGDINNHRRHREISLKNKIISATEVLFAIK